MTSVSCKFCTSKIFLLCCSNQSNQENLFGVCDKCLVSIPFGSQEERCQSCSNDINRELLQYKQYFIRIQEAQVRAMFITSHGPRRSTGNLNQLSHNYGQNGRKTQTSLHPENNQNHNFGFNQGLINSSKSSFFADTQVKLTPDMLKQFHENADVKVGSSARLSFERNKGQDRNQRAMQLEDRQIRFSETSTYRDLQI